jgi:hypothetical protein
MGRGARSQFALGARSASDGPVSGEKCKVMISEMHLMKGIAEIPTISYLKAIMTQPVPPWTPLAGGRAWGPRPPVGPLRWWRCYQTLPSSTHSFHHEPKQKVNKRYF